MKSVMVLVAVAGLIGSGSGQAFVIDDFEATPTQWTVNGPAGGAVLGPGGRPVVFPSYGAGGASRGYDERGRPIREGE